MMRLGMEAQGVEPSPIAARLARNSGLKVFCGMLSEARFADDSFDCISLYHVLEHTPNPIEVLRECRRILKPDGEIVVGVPNFESMTFALIGRVWGGLDPPRHLQHFRPASITRAAGRAGLAVAAMETESLVEHVERELVGWLRQRLFVPARLMLAMGAVRPLAAYLARKGNASNRGEAIVVHLQKNGSW